MRVALAQVITGRDLAENLRLLEEYARRAKDGGAELVVFPEAMMRAFGNSLLDIAEPLAGPWASRVRSLADELQLVIVAGMFTPGTPSDSGSPPRVRNTLLATGPGVETSYDKIHLFDAFGFAESDTVEAGTDPVTFDAGGLTFGLATCYDIRFPALFTANAQRGAIVNIVSASWGDPDRVRPSSGNSWPAPVQWTPPRSCSPAARAIPPLRALRSKGPRPPEWGGTPPSCPRSARYWKPGGGEPGVIFYDLDPAVVEEARTKLPVLANRRDF